MLNIGKYVVWENSVFEHGEQQLNTKFTAPNEFSCSPPLIGNGLCLPLRTRVQWMKEHKCPVPVGHFIKRMIPLARAGKRPARKWIAFALRPNRQALWTGNRLNRQVTFRRRRLKKIYYFSLLVQRSERQRRNGGHLRLRHKPGLGFTMRASDLWRLLLLWSVVNVQLGKLKLLAICLLPSMNPLHLHWHRAAGLAFPFDREGWPLPPPIVLCSIICIQTIPIFPMH